MAIVLGIDPGVSGALAWLDGCDLHIEKMPATPQALAALLRSTFPGIPTAVYLEQQWARPSPAEMKALKGEDCRQGRGSVSQAKFMQQYGQVQGVLAALDMDWTEVPPRRWQGALGIKKTGGSKSVLQQFAQSLFPEARIIQQVADAVLIAEYGKRVLWHENLKRRTA